MKQQTHKIDNTEYIFVEVPKDASDFKFELLSIQIGYSRLFFSTKICKNGK